MQKLSILLLCAELNGVATARMPGALAHAGFDVSVLAPRDALITRSRYARRTGHFPNDCTFPFWVQTLAAAIRAHAPVLIVPGDDRTITLLRRVLAEPPPGLVPAQHARLVELIERSLGDPRFYEVASSKFLLGDAAIAAGVGVPDQRVTTGQRAVLDAARVYGYPVVLKRERGGRGDSVCIVADDYSALRYCGQGTTEPVLVQRYIKGQSATFGAVALGGRLLAGLTAIEVCADPPQTGQGTVLQLAGRADVATLAAKMTEVLGLSGFASFDFILADDGGIPYLLGCSPRVSVASYIGTHFGVDLARELYGALAGARSGAASTAQPLRELTVALFPQEWLRSPQSPALRTCVIDAPWDDPELFAAMVKGAGVWPA